MKEFTVLIFCTAIFASAAYAETRTCENVRIRSFQVEGQGDDVSTANRLLVTLSDVKGFPVKCGGADIFFLENNDSAYMGVLTTALAANLVKKNVRIGVVLPKEMPKKNVPVAARIAGLGFSE